jgi:multicomponent Na+:H+ antiporter subunit E
VAVAGRFTALLGLWLVLSGAEPGGLPFGLAAAALAARASLRLLPPAGYAIRPWPVLCLGLAVLHASVVAGLDIARRAFDPRLPIRPGMVAVPLRLPPGPGRDGFRLLASLQPGSMPVGLDAAGRLVVHALDTRLPITAETQEAEARFAAAIHRCGGHG